MHYFIKNNIKLLLSERNWILYHKAMNKHYNLPSGVHVVQLISMPNGGSDRRFKKEVQPIDNSLEKVLKLRPITWYWKTDTQSMDLQYGFIAQEVEKIFPHLIEEKEQEDGSTRKYMSTGDLIPYLTQALKEQQEQLTALRRQLDS